MKKILLISIMAIVLIGIQANAQFTNKTMQFGGLTRSYRIYVSPNYNAANPASLIIALHGMGDNMTNFSGLGFQYIADTANIICIYPQAVTDPIAGTAWNSSAGQYGYYPNSSVNDVGFINALVDTTVANYSVDITRVYLCGFSMGGFMTQKMALQSNLKFAAFGSMSGTFGNGLTNFSPGRSVPIAHFHGTADSTVYYTGNLYGEDPEPMVDFWVTNNLCDTPAVVYNYPHVATDTITVERYEYSNGDPQSDVWFFKMYNANHTVLYQPDNDITEIIELWYFFRGHTFIEAGLNDQPVFSENVVLYPNPVLDQFTVTVPVKSSIEVLNTSGQVILETNAFENSSIIDFTNFAKGIYFVKVKSTDGVAVRKILKQ